MSASSGNFEQNEAAFEEATRRAAIEMAAQPLLVLEEEESSPSEWPGVVRDCVIIVCVAVTFWLWKGWI